ncbi:MAG: type II toxin-antitoxin system RelE/ParE family toxin [Magnetococcales bacterium]|nr:type II toxin-antitoxin system RelE/ParE family toxin [Magnetococcales bacterium]
MRILQTRSFNNAAKRRHANQKRDLDDAVRTVAADPAIGETKIGDLAGVRVFKFTMTNQLTLLAYFLAET